MDPLYNRASMPNTESDQITNMAKALLPEYLRDKPYPKNWPTQPGKMESVEHGNFAPFLTMDLISNTAGAGAKALGAGLKGAIFAGPMARGASKEAYELAHTVFGNRKDPLIGTVLPGVDDSFIRRLWGKTGVSPGIEGAPRHEINDNPMVIKGIQDIENPEFRPIEGKVGQIVQHKQLFDAYPWMKDVPLRIKHGEEAGMYDPFERAVEIQVQNNAEARHSLIHELQHVVQHRENFPPWGNPEAIKGHHAGFNQPPSSDIMNGPLDKNAYSLYRRLAGEVEAENASNRASGNRYLLPPWETEETTRANQLVPHRWLSGQPPNVRAAFEPTPNLGGDMQVNPDLMYRLRGF